jgi:hypothetical protein
MERAVQIYPNRADFQWAYSGGKSGAPLAEASWAFANAGYYVMRSGWDSQAIWALFDGGPFGFSHQHEDKLNLMVAAYGRLLLTEAGDYAYDDSEMRRYVLSTRAHNTIRVDGQDQNRRANYDRDQLDLQALAGADWLSTDSYDMVAALYDEGYGPQADTAVSHHRRVIFLKQPPAGLDPCFVVIDRLEAKDNEAHGYETLWHFNTVTATRLSVTTVQSQDAGQSNLTVIAAARPGLEVSVIEGQEEPEWQGWKSTQHNAQGGNVPAPTAAYQLSARDSVRLVWLLYPTPPGQDCPVEAVEAETPLDHTTIRLVLVDGETIDLDEGDFLATS